MPVQYFKAANAPDQYFKLSPNETEAYLKAKKSGDRTEFADLFGEKVIEKKGDNFYIFDKKNPDVKRHIIELKVDAHPGFPAELAKSKSKSKKKSKSKDKKRKSGSKPKAAPKKTKSNSRK